jgi:O-antigen chain-terminating methyltransferase
MRHTDALYAVVDQKLDRYRRDSDQLKSKLGSLVALSESTDAAATNQQLETAWKEQTYLALEDRFRGTDNEIKERVRVYLPRFPDGGNVLDLGCGRGETLAVLKEGGIVARGVDSSAEMVRHCVDLGFDVEQADLLAELRRAEGDSLGGVISLHVIEHLPEETLSQLIRLAWRALRPGGVLILETPNPLSIVVSARNFWRDPTHVRPIHPDTLALMFEQAGFDPVERLELRPFADGERLPEVDVAGLAEDSKQLGETVNKIRDQIDSLLYGHQDFAIIETKPSA